MRQKEYNILSKNFPDLRNLSLTKANKYVIIPVGGARMRWTTRTDWVIVMVAFVLMLFCAWGLLSEPPQKEVSSVKEEIMNMESRVADMERQTRHIDIELSALEATLPVPTPTSTPTIVQKE
jgi:type II secretory pathway component PulM